MKKRLKHLLILEGIAIIFGISLIANQGKPNTYYSTDLTLDDQETELSKSIVRGEEIYTDFCMQCHLPDGKGTPKVFPPLAGSDWLTNKRKESIHSLKYGLNGPITVNGESYNSAMTSLGLEDEEIADVMNYISNTWGNKNEMLITREEVSKIQPKK